MPATLLNVFKQRAKQTYYNYYCYYVEANPIRLGFTFPISISYQCYRNDTTSNEFKQALAFKSMKVKLLTFRNIESSSRNNQFILC